MATTKDRLREVIRDLGLRQVDVVERCNRIIDSEFVDRPIKHVTSSQMSEWLSGRYEPNQWSLTVLSMVLGVDETWLMGFDVPRNSTERRVAEAHVDLIEKFSRLSPENQTTILVLIDSLLSRQS